MFYSLPLQQYVHSLHGSNPIALMTPSKDWNSKDEKLNLSQIAFLRFFPRSVEESLYS